MGGGWKMAMVGLVVVMGGVMSSMGDNAQVGAQCSDGLAPCLDSLNSTNPPDSCCNPLQHMASSDLTCLCFLYTNTAFLQSFGVNHTFALRIARRCGVSTSFAHCTLSAPAPTQVTLPPATPGADGGGVRRVSCTRGLSFLLLFWTSMLAVQLITI